MGYGLMLNLDPQLLKDIFLQMLPVLAQHPIYRHVGSMPESEAAEQEAQHYLHEIRRNALSMHGEWGQRFKGAWASVYQFGSMFAAGVVDTVKPLPTGFSRCLIQKDCRSLAVSTQDIVGDMLNFVTMAPAQLAMYFLEDHTHQNAFDRAYAGTQTTIVCGLLAANLLGIAKLKLPTHTPDMMLPPVVQSGYAAVAVPTMSIDGLSMGRLGSGILMMDASGSAGGSGTPDRITSDDIRAAVQFNPESPSQMTAKIGIQKRRVLQQIFDTYRSMAMKMIDVFKSLEEGRISPEHFLNLAVKTLQETERAMQTHLSNAGILVDGYAVGTLMSHLRSQFVEILRFAIRDLFKQQKEGPLALPSDVDALLKGWGKQIDNMGWSERDQALLIHQLDSLYNIDLTLVRVRKGVSVPLEHVMAGIERSAYQAVVDYEQMAMILRGSATERVIETILMKVAVSFERTGVLMEAAAEKIRRGESTRLTPNLSRMMDALPVYSTQIAIVSEIIPHQQWTVLSQCRALLAAYSQVMGRPLPSEAAALLQRLNEVIH